MPENFYAILTNIGKAKIANAILLNQKVNFSQMALGDSNGVYVNPQENQTALVHEVWRGGVGAITIDSVNPNWIVIETALPAQTGGFMIREAGIYDVEGDLVAVAKYPETYKPALSEGSVKDLLIRMILEVSNTSAVTLKVDPTVILATKKDLEKYSLLTHHHDERYYQKTEINTLLDNKVNQSANVYQLPLSLGVTKVNASTYFKQGNIVTLTMKLLIEYQKLENYRIATLPIGFHPSSEFTHCGAYMQYLNQEGHIAATCGTGIWIAPLDGAIYISEFYGNPFVNDRVNYPKAYVMASMSFSIL